MAFATPLTTPPLALRMSPEKIDIWPTKMLREPPAHRTVPLLVMPPANAVKDVYAKRYVAWGLDDQGIYGRDSGRQWEDTAVFEATFGR